MKNKVVVVGAGTSGLIAAKKLGSFGIDTTVYDQRKTLDEPSKASGILSINGLKSLGIDYSKAITNTLYGAVVHAGRQSMKVLSGEPKAHVLDRIKLNALCLDEAEESGAKILLGERITGSRLEALSKSSIIIGADGAVSNVARHFSMGPMERYVLTYKAEYNACLHDPRFVELYFDKSFAPGLFAWLCPNSNDVLEVGIGISPGRGNARAAYEKFINREEISELIGNAKMIGGHASVIPMRLRRKMVDEKNGVLLVGDAAGQVKPSTGGGIIFGGNGAILAAQTIREHLEMSSSLSLYEQRYKKRYMLDTRIHSLVNMLYSKMGPESIGIAIRIMKYMGIDGFLGRYGEMDMPSLMLKKALGLQARG